MQTASYTAWRYIHDQLLYVEGLHQTGDRYSYTCDVTKAAKLTEPQ